MMLFGSQCVIGFVAYSFIVVMHLALDAVRREDGRRLFIYYFNLDITYIISLNQVGQFCYYLNHPHWKAIASIKHFSSHS
jgi:hypothetical protein